jgi:peptidoglycan hydrolase-like protein with peptidoglycan-binding domain
MEENKEVKAESVALAVEPVTIPAVVIEAKPKPMKAEGGEVSEITVEVVEKKEAPAPAAAAPEGKKLAGSGVFIQLSALKHNSRAKNSRSVASVQSRLIELGFSDAGNDMRGTFGDSTLEALTAFHKDSKVKADACTDEPVIVALFKGTAVEVIA